MLKSPPPPQLGCTNSGLSAQDDLNKLTEWSEKWQMLFNFGKCKCLYTGHGNEDAQYTMGGTLLILP